ncbi:MAG: hypothetical protein WCJ30_12775 [Deltaproteobacteria bacterium]
MHEARNGGLRAAGDRRSRRGDRGAQVRAGGQSLRLGLPSTAAAARQNLGLALARTGSFDEARTVETAALEVFRTSGNRRMEAASSSYLAHILFLAGDLDAAEREARAAIALASEPPLLPPSRAEGLAGLAQVLLAKGGHAEALEAAREAMDLLDAIGGIDGGEGGIRLVWAEALHSRGELDAARSAIAAARERLLAAAAKIDDEAVRRMYLERVPDHARTLELARAWIAP